MRYNVFGFMFRAEGSGFRIWGLSFIQSSVSLRWLSDIYLLPGSCMPESGGINVDPDNKTVCVGTQVGS